MLLNMRVQIANRAPITSGFFWVGEAFLYEGEVNPVGPIKHLYVKELVTLRANANSAALYFSLSEPFPSTFRRFSQG